jgi:hypothetical protein
MTGEEALTTAAGLIGAGGLTSIVLGFLAFKTHASKGRNVDGGSVMAGIGEALAPGADIELLANAISMLSSAINRQTSFMEECDRVRREDQEAAERAELKELARLATEFRRSQGGDR